jgi:hypothetical protein
LEEADGTRRALGKAVRVASVARDWGLAVVAVDCGQPAAAVGPASLLAAGEWQCAASFHAAASCVHHSGSKLPAFYWVEVE